MIKSTICFSTRKRTYEPRLLRNSKELTDSIDGILVSFASMLFVAPASNHTLDIPEARLLDNVVVATFDRARSEELLDALHSHEEQASTFSAVNLI